MTMNPDDYQHLQEKIESLEMQIISLEQTNNKLKQDNLYLELNEAKVLEIQRLASIYSWEFSILSRRIKCSDRLLEILNKTSKEKTFFEELLQIIHPDDVVSFEKLYNDSVSQKVPFEVVHRLVFPNGEERIVNHYCKTFFLENGMPLKSMGLMQDITQLKKIEQRLKMAIAESTQLNQNLEAKVKERTQELEAALTQVRDFQLQVVQKEKMSALGNLVAGVAHEINNPIGFLKSNLRPAQDYIQDLLGLLDLYQAKMPNPDADIEDEIEAIDLDFIREDLPKLLISMNLGVDRIQAISNSLRTFSRQDQEYKTTFDLHEGIDSTLLILKHHTKANERHPEVEVVKNYGELCKVQCFPGQLNQVFMNILANAIDAFEEVNQGKTFQEIKANPNRITITTSVVDEQVKIQIQDNGCGMKPETVKRIFEQGFTTKEVGKGTGLGMAIAKQILEEKHGGAIACHSELGKGTEFVIFLPIS